MTELSYNIYRAMDKHDVSLTELARRINVDRSGLYNRLKNPKMLRVEEVMKIGAAIGVDWRHLLEGLDE